MKIRILSIILLLVLLLTACQSSGIDLKAAEEKWGKRDFEYNGIMVYIAHEESMQFIEYTPEDFAEIGCIKVNDYSSAAAERIQRVMRGEISEDQWGAWMDKNVTQKDIDSFRRILFLELEDQTREGVLRALTIMEQKENIYRVEPNWILTLA